MMNNSSNIILLLITFICSNSLRAGEVTAELRDIYVVNGRVAITLEISNHSNNEIVIDQMFLGFDLIPLTQNVLKVSKVENGSKKLLPYQGRYSSYSGSHDYNKSAIHIKPEESIFRKLNISANYSIDKSGYYEISYGAIFNTKIGKQALISNKFTFDMAKIKNSNNFIPNRH